MRTLKAIPAPCLLSLMVLCLGLPTAAPAQNEARAIPAMRMVPSPRSLTEFLREDALVYARFAGLEAASQAFSSGSMASLWQEEAIQSFAAPWIAGMKAEAERLSPRLLELAAALEGAAAGSLEIALTGTTLAWSRELQPTLLPNFIAALDLGPQFDTKEAEVIRLLERAFGPTKGGEPELHFGLNPDGIPLYRHATDIMGLQLAVTRTRIGRVMLIAMNPWTLREALTRSAKRAGTLAAVQSLGSARSEYGPGALAELWIHLDAAQRVLSPLFPDEARRAMEQLGLDRIQGLYLATGLAGGRSKEFAFLASERPHKALLGLTGTRALSPQMAALAPAGTLLFGAGQLDLLPTFEAVMRLADDLLPARLARTLRGGIRVAGAAVGGDLERDVLQVFGPEIGLFLSVGSEQLMPETGLILEVKDADKALSAVKRLAQLAGVEVRTLPLPEGTKGVSGAFALEMDQFAVPFTPSFAFVGKHLVFGAHRSTIEGVLKRVASSTEGFAAAALFRETMGQGTQGDTSGLLVADLPRLATEALKLGRDLAPMLPFKLPTGLPPVEAVAGHLSPLVLRVSPRESGIAIEARGFGLGAMLGGLAAAARSEEGRPLVLGSLLQMMLGR